MVQRIKLAEATKHELNHQVFHYLLRHVKIKSELLTSGSSNFEFDNQFLEHIVQPCENHSMYGVFKENRFYFKHNNLESLTASVDNDTLDLDFDNGNYVKAYDIVMHSTGQYKDGCSMLLD